MSKLILLICVITCSKGIFVEVSSNIIITSYEKFRDLLDKLNTVTKVRTKAELQAKGNELAILDFIGLVQQYEGYEAEEYDAQTEDGYILKLHRIISSPHSPNVTNKSVVFIQPGLAGCSDMFVNLGASHGLAFMIADAGYDVWLGNVRGSIYSRRHVKYPPASTNYNYWKFNIDDIALKDAPAMIDAVLKETKKTKLIFIGHSMGSMMNYMLLSSKPEYNDKIDLSISLAPEAYFMRPFPLFVTFILSIRLFIPLFHALRIYEFLPLSIFVVFFAKTVCANFIGVYVCGAIFSPMLNFNNVNHNNMSSIYSVVYNGASLDTLAHFGQLLSTEKFRKFDFGPRLNREKYNSSEPPEYDLAKVTAPQAIFYADRDVFINTKAVEKGKKRLKNVVAFEKVPENYNHLDFLWAKNARTEYYYKILNLIKEFSK